MLHAVDIQGQSFIHFQSASLPSAWDELLVHLVLRCDNSDFVLKVYTFTDFVDTFSFFFLILTLTLWV